MADRARHTLVNSALAPAGEARFAPNSDGLRPGRSCHDAIAAIFTAMGQKAPYGLDADIEKCFDRMAHEPLLAKRSPSPYLRRQLRAWLKAGVLDHGPLFPPDTGTMQGRPLSPLLANVALHGLETAITHACPPRSRQHGPPPNVVVDADDRVILHHDRSVREPCQHLIAKWLRPLGLRLKPSKTRITHTLETHDGQPGFDFLGFHLRQYPVGHTTSGKESQGRFLGFKTLITPSRGAMTRQRTKRHPLITHAQQATPRTLLGARAPHMRGWRHYYSRVVSAKAFRTLDHTLYTQLRRWAMSRHPNKSKHWIMGKYWRVDEGKGWRFHPPVEGRALTLHSPTPIRRHVQVQATRRPYDGDWVYGSIRLGRHPPINPRVARRLRKQQGRCRACGLSCTENDTLDVDHIIPKAQGGNERDENLPLLPRHCHARQTAQDRRGQGTYDTRHGAEEPDDAKASRPVLNPSRGGDTPA